MDQERSTTDSPRAVNERTVEHCWSQRVNTGWAVSIPLDNAAAAAALRQHADVEACKTDGRLWLKGKRCTESLDRTLRQILGAERYHRFKGNQLAVWGCSVPSTMLPDASWTSFREWLQPVLPQATLPATL